MSRPLPLSSLADDPVVITGAARTPMGAFLSLIHI